MSTVPAEEIADLRAAGIASHAYSEHVHTCGLLGEPVAHLDALRIALTVGLVMLQGHHGAIGGAALSHAVHVAEVAWSEHDRRAAMLLGLRAYRRAQETRSIVPAPSVSTPHRRTGRSEGDGSVPARTGLRPAGADPALCQPGVDDQEGPGHRAPDAVGVDGAGGSSHEGRHAGAPPTASAPRAHGAHDPAGRGGASPRGAV